MPLDMSDFYPEQTNRDQKTEQPSEAEYSEFDLKLIARRKIVFERRARGDSDDEILHFLAQNGHPISRRTLHNDLKSDEVLTFKDELIRLQLRDIALLRGYAWKDLENPDLKAVGAAINARSQLLKNLTPKDNNVNVAVNVSQQSTVSLDLLAKYDALIAAEANAQTSDFSRDDTK